MSIQSDTILKTYFETGDLPTQEEFEHLIDSKYSKHHGLGVAVAVNGSYEIQINENQMLSRVVVYTQNGNADISLGDTLGSKEHLEDEALVLNEPRVFDIDPIFSILGQSVFLTFGNTGVSIGVLVYYIQ